VRKEVRRGRRSKMRKSREKIVRKRDREKDSPTLTPIPIPTANTNIQ
jgi:hypothetical protein